MAELGDQAFQFCRVRIDGVARCRGEKGIFGADAHGASPVHAARRPGRHRDCLGRGVAPTGRRKWALLARHQVGALAATAVDFGVMVALVSSGLARPWVATAFGAACGAVTNFTLGRSWIFGAGRGGPAAQAARYAVVSAVGLGLNSAGVYGVHDRLGVPYVAARAMVAIAVSLLWNFPVQRRFVFA